MLDPKDEVILPVPYWVSYPEMVKLAGAVPKFVLADDRTGFRLTPAMVESAITPRTRQVFIANPNNPTGTLVDKDQLEKLLDMLPEHTWVVLDEAYAEFADASLLPFVTAFDDVHSLAAALRAALT